MRLPPHKLTGVRLAAFDLDGTLLNGQRVLSRATLDMLAALPSAGIQGTIVTARSPLMAEVFYRQIPGENIPIVALNGALVLCAGTGEIISRCEIDPAAAADLIRYCHSNLFDYTIYTETAAWMRPGSKRRWRMEQYNLLAERQGTRLIPCRIYDGGDLRGLLKDHVLKIILEDPGPTASSQLQSFLCAYPSIRLDCSEGTSITLTDQYASKGRALRTLSERLGYAPHQICCFGDYYNDMEMFSAANYSVAMGNAPPDVRDAARYVTRPNTEDGVAWFINHYII